MEGEAWTLQAVASSPRCDPSSPPPPPDLPTHLQVLRRGQQDPGHIQSHIPLPQDRSCVAAQVWRQLASRGLGRAPLALAPVRLISAHAQAPAEPPGFPTPGKPTPPEPQLMPLLSYPAPPSPRGLPWLTFPLRQPMSHISSP